jgi:hypothetical protein
VLVAMMSMNTNGFVESTEEWLKFLREEYHRVLEDRLPPDELNDPAARKRAMKPEVNWYNAEVRAYVAENPKGRKSVKFAVRTLTRMVRCQFVVVTMFY